VIGHLSIRHHSKPLSTLNLQEKASIGANSKTKNDDDQSDGTLFILFHKARSPLRWCGAANIGYGPRQLEELELGYPDNATAASVGQYRL
jgi:hypothetical protein